MVVGSVEINNGTSRLFKTDEFVKRIVKNIASLCGWLSKCVVRSFSRSLTTYPSLLSGEGQVNSEVQCGASGEDEDDDGEEVERGNEKGTVK